MLIFLWFGYEQFEDPAKMSVFRCHGHIIGEKSKDGFGKANAIEQISKNDVVWGVVFEIHEVENIR